MRPALAVLAVLGALLAVAGCGEKEDVTTSGSGERLTVMLDYFPNADHAPIYAAIAADEFAKAGLEVELRPPPTPASPLSLLEAGKVDLAISYEPQVLLAQDKGQDVVAVGALVQVPLTSLISLPKQRIRSPRDLAGKTVGTAGIPYQTAFLDTILERAGVPPDRVARQNLGDRLVPGLLTERVDAVLGAFWNYEGVELELDRRNPTIQPVDKLGVPPYNELVLVARGSEVRERSSAVRRFLQALSRGARALRANPKPGIDALLRDNPDLDRRLQTASVAATMKADAFFPADPDEPWGFMDPVAWQRFAAWMVDRRLIDQMPNIREVQTNGLLPGKGI